MQSKSTRIAYLKRMLKRLEGVHVLQSAPVVKQNLSPATVVAKVSITLDIVVMLEGEMELT